MDDERFQERLEREYAPDQIGDADGDVEIDEDGLVTKEALDEAVSEFIESQKLRDRNLYKKFGDDTEEIVPILKKPNEIKPDEAEVEKDRQELISNFLLDYHYFQRNHF